MARSNRQDVYRADDVATVHVTHRCVRGLYLLGQDAVSGKDFSHRLQWLQSELERCNQYFGIQTLEHSFMATHLHLLLRSRPDIVKGWSNTEVARRWLSLCPKRKNKDGTFKEPTSAEIRTMLKNRILLKEIRKRLSDISWFVRLIFQRVAQKANRETQEKGKFWDGRFHAISLVDEAAVLACAAYINLNPIRAAIATTIETSNYTSLQQRLRDLLAELPSQDQAAAAQAYAQTMAEFGIDTGSTEHQLDDQLDDQLASDPLASPQPLNAQLISDDLLADDVLISDVLISDALVAEAQQADLPSADSPEAEVVGTAALDALAAGAQAQLAAASGSAVWVDDEDDDAESPEMAAMRLLPPEPYRRSGYLAPVQVNESPQAIGACPSRSEQRCSDRGFLNMTAAKFAELVDFSARLIRADKRGFTPADTPPIVQRLGISIDAWYALVTNFDNMFSLVAGMPASVDAYRGRRSKPYYMSASTRAILTGTAETPVATPTTPANSQAASASVNA